MSLEFREALSGTPRARLRSVKSNSKSSLIVVCFIRSLFYELVS
jgi:hypothetical protein